jgi:hypothetical protein
MFCVKCGSPRIEGRRFCPGCGAIMGSHGKRAPRASAKMLLCSFGCLVALAAIGWGGFLYISHRPHAQAHAQAERSIQVAGSDALGGASEENSAPRHHLAVCGLATRQEVAATTKMPIVKVAGNEDGDLCTYSPSDDSVKTVTVQVAWEGGEFAMRAGAAVMQGAAGGAEFRHTVPGIGDEAFVLGVGQETQQQLNHDIRPELKALATLTTGPLMFRKGDVMVTVTANFIEDKLEAGKQIAMKVASRL